MLKIRFSVMLFLFAIISIINISNIRAAGFTTTADDILNVNDGILNLTDEDISNAGTLQIGTGAINLGGNWTNTGTFNSGTNGTVVFTGSTASTITGTNNFFNFTCTQAGKTLNFEVGKTQTITGIWTLTGITGNLISLRSSSAGTQWSVNPSGTKNITFIDVKDSNNLGTVVNPASSSDSGNNINWFSSVQTPTPTPGVTPTPTPTPTQLPTAAFNANKITGFTPLTVNFVDQSTGDITSWLWDFGDGSIGILPNPSHVYTLAGRYTVELVVTGPGGSDSAIRTGFINVRLQVAPVAEFDADPIGGFEPLTVGFIDRSTGGPSSWAWEFGDGTISAEQSPTHTYQQDGNFAVRLTVSNSKGSDIEEKLNLIAVKSIPPCRAAFNADKTSGFVPLEVNFSDKSSGDPTSWAWEFGDGDISSEQNPTHIYRIPGIFSVTLTVSGPCGTDVLTQTNLMNLEKAP
ncbi:MAG: PKD domain-containing protein, partial [Candidatus Anammoxibacter sp.]